MSNIAKLKKKAFELEQKKQYEKALELYEQVLSFGRSSDEERDVPLYNRVGDLHFRLGNMEQAIGYYEKAVDLYAEGGFFNNAIALCNKILRYSPGRNSAYYKLGLISARKGFNSDAKQNFLEYADRMQKVGKLDEAFRALKEFADLCPGQDDVRLMLAEQLARADRKTEALEQLQLLYQALEGEGRAAESAATIERMKALDPTFSPRRSTAPLSRKKSGLVFLDLGEDDVAAFAETETGPTTESEPGPRSTAGEAPPDAGAAAAVPEGFEQTSLVQPVLPAEVPSGISREVPEEASRDAASVASETPSEMADGRESEVPPTVTQDPLAGIYIVPPSGESEKPAPEELPEHQESGGKPADGSGDTGHAAAGTAATPEASDEYFDLGAWLEATRTPMSTRMVAHDEEPLDDQQRDFAEMLSKFKQGLAESIDDTDFESHYDLGIAFREMGLLDEAISSFQRALRSPQQSNRAAEALGECFLDKNEPAVALAILDRALREGGSDDDLVVGLLYLTGRANEALGNASDAVRNYQRVVALDIRFRDAADRLAAMTTLSR